MLIRPRPNLKRRRAFQRVAALVVFALQLAVMGSSVWEPRAGVLLGAHAEEKGDAQHADQHSEESCVVCGARLQTSAPAGPAPEIAFASAASAPMARAVYATTGVQPLSTQSRAPPRS